MSKVIILHDYKFVANNFSAILDHEGVPEAYHVIQDFLRVGPVGYALTQPEKFSVKACIQIWSTDDTKDVNNFTFTHNNREYKINRRVIEEALHLQDKSFVESFKDDDVSNWLKDIEYKGDMKRMGKLTRTKLRKEWNFFFDCLGKAFTNKCSNFDALTQVTQQIGYGLLHDALYDIPSKLLEFLKMRREENDHVIYFPRFLHLCFFNLCGNVAFENDTMLDAHKNSPRTWQDMDKDVKNGFATPIEYPSIITELLQVSLPDIYGARVQDTNESNPPVSNPSTPHTQSKHSLTTSSSSQKLLVVKNTKSSNLSEEQGTSIPARVAEDAGDAMEVDDDEDDEDEVPIAFVVGKRKAAQTSSVEVAEARPVKRKRLVKAHVKKL